MVDIELVMTSLEYLGMIIGVLTVLCLIYERVWAWPLGVLYCLLTAPVMWHNALYGYLTLTLVGFLPMNLYGWYFWLFGSEQTDQLHVTNVPIVVFFVGLVLCVLGVWLLPFVFSWLVPNYLETASYMHLDNAILVLSLVAMWFTARKWIENWWIWLVVNIGTVVLYGLLELWGLTVLYCLYIGMAIWGLRTWRISMKREMAIG